ncbi:hypothetical protein FOIG_00804 [Fusarium odoratissimum NRRL 54006]|uniref:Uncharacterized protein n=2 Tax=Fusarium oxysporum species complex TaxID=171631 RepID=X0LQR0_FUSO5|nr:uncharacterized protein FOIG_00804 [Fusarium odoratissimum NRRL 54006]EXM10905.1 hypothetical protein FOIG_00804 [Fusarium odoratissimum NRRL 54006]TXC04062.1 hypothetical protein FocTR4_00001349 [Fusarium oxysporum f. sp. cubense]
MPYVWYPEALERLGAESWDEVRALGEKGLAKKEAREQKKRQAKAAKAPLGCRTSESETPSTSGWKAINIREKKLAPGQTTLSNENVKKRKHKDKGQSADAKRPRVDGQHNGV